MGRWRGGREGRERKAGEGEGGKVDKALLVTGKACSEKVFGVFGSTKQPLDGCVTPGRTQQVSRPL